MGKSFIQKLYSKKHDLEQTIKQSDSEYRRKVRLKELNYVKKQITAYFA